MNPQQGEPMSLVVALANKDSIVLAADTICMLGGSEAHYRYDAEFSKIFSLRNPKFGIGVAGHSTTEQFVDMGQETDTIDRLIGTIQNAVRNRYKEKQLTYEMLFLFCGFAPNDAPIIETLHFDLNNSDGRREEIGPRTGRAAIGLCKHGALYLIHSYHSLEMTTEQLAFLAYFTLKEAIFHDERLRGPIQLATLRPSSRMTFYSPEQQKKLDEICTERRTAIKELLTKPIDGFSMQLLPQPDLRLS